jgi:hypothetical protein
MTVAELIEVLQQFPPDTRFVVDGYEGDLEDIAHVGIRRAEIDGNLRLQKFGFGDDLISAHEVGMGKHRFSDDQSSTDVVWIHREDWGR